MAEKFRYPLSELNKDDDFIQFSIIEYKRKAGSQREIRSSTNDPISEELKNEGKNWAPNLPVLETKKTDLTLGGGNNILIGGADPNIAAKVNILLPIPSQLSDSNSTKYGEGTLNSFAAAALNSVLNIQDSANPDQFFDRIGANLQGLSNLADNRVVKQLASIFTATQAINALSLIHI